MNEQRTRQAVMEILLTFYLKVWPWPLSWATHMDHRPDTLSHQGKDLCKVIWNPSTNNSIQSGQAFKDKNLTFDLKV